MTPVRLLPVRFVRYAWVRSRENAISLAQLACRRSRARLIPCVEKHREHHLRYRLRHGVPRCTRLHSYADEREKKSKSEKGARINERDRSIARACTRDAPLSIFLEIIWNMQIQLARTLTRDVRVCTAWRGTGVKGKGSRNGEDRACVRVAHGSVLSESI